MAGLGWLDWSGLAGWLAGLGWLGCWVCKVWRWLGGWAAGRLGGWGWVAGAGWLGLGLGGWVWVAGLGWVTGMTGKSVSTYIHTYIHTYQVTRLAAVETDMNRVGLHCRQ